MARVPSCHQPCNLPCTYKPWTFLVLIIIRPTHESNCCLKYNLVKTGGLGVHVGGRDPLNGSFLAFYWSYAKSKPTIWSSTMSKLLTWRPKTIQQRFFWGNTMGHPLLLWGGLSKTINHLSIQFSRNDLRMQ